MFEGPTWSERVDDLGRLWGVEGQAFQSGSSWGPEGEDGKPTPVSMCVMYPGIVIGDDTHLTIETSIHKHASFDLLQHYFLNASMAQATFPIVVDRWEAPIPTDLGPVAFTFIGDQHYWAAEASLDGQTIRVTAHGHAWQEVKLTLLEASDVFPLSEFAARVLALRSEEQADTADT